MQSFKERKKCKLADNLNKVYYLAFLQQKKIWLTQPISLRYCNAVHAINIDHSPVIVSLRTGIFLTFNPTST